MLSSLFLKSPRSRHTKPLIFSESFADDVKPHPVSIPPEENAFYNVFATFAQLATHKKRSGQSGSDLLKPKSKFTGVKVEKVEDEDFLFGGSQPASRSGPRKSEPGSSLADRMSSIQLNERSSSPNTPAARRKQPRKLESIPASTSYEPKPPSSLSSSNNQGNLPADAFNSTNPEKAVFELFSEHRSYDYQQLDTTLEYSDYKLMPHQAYGRKWMADQESDGRNGGIVADEMGLGKTLQALVRIKDDRISAIARGETVGPTLVVGPKSILLQWEEEIRRTFHFDERLICKIYHGANRYLDKTDIVLTTYGILNSDHESTEATKWTRRYGLFKHSWRRLILDEAHEIRNPGTKKAKAAFAVNAEYRWCLTGTPIQNKLYDLFSLFHLLGVKDFSEDQWFKRNIEAPGARSRNSIRPGAQRLLKIALGSTMLRRLKTDEVNGCPILSLPPLQITIWDCQFSPSEREFYDALEARMKDIIEELLNQLEQGDIRFYSTAWVLLLRLRQACLHPSLLIEQRLEQVADDVGSKERRQDVSNKDNRCLLCRNQTNSDKHKEECGRFIDMAKIFSRNQASTKIKITLDLLREIKTRPGNEKTIIFSQFTSMLNIIEPFLQRQGIRFARLDGTMDMNRRKQQLSDIREMPRVTVILVSLRTGGVGLNLTECNNVILFDLWWNPAVEEQAFARAHRMGQIRPVNVYKLVTENTVEERIMELQDRKKKLATETLDRDEIENLKKLSKKELLSLMACHL
ncbi:P-loop containing nucleoside triphosphate hydrolase protein [Lentinula aff. detonsa]|nr:P-loop containing nucleoside triphosphate hydrolase protein [Lentinula aff. detonsa]